MQLSTMDAWLLRRAFSKMPIDKSKASPLLQAQLSIFNPETETGYELLSKFVTSDTELMTQVMKLDPNTEPVNQERPKKVEIQVHIPQLPKEALLSDKALKEAETLGTWFKRTSQWTSQQSPMTPPHFLEGATLWLAGLAIARRAYLHLHERIYPHLYYLIVAETSRFAKSTGMNLFYHIILKTIPHLLIPGSVTTEGMIELLSGQKPSNYDKLPTEQKLLIDNGITYAGQRGFMLDEYSSLLATGKKDYMQGFIELLLRLYDAREKEDHYTKSGGWFKIDRPALSIFGATTPAAMSRALTNESWENGEMARYFILFREEVRGYSDTYGSWDVPEEITRALRAVDSKLPIMVEKATNQRTNNEALSVSITQDALLAYKAYAKAVRHDMLDDCDPRLHGNYTRFHVQALKMAISLATFDCLPIDKPIRIELGHWALAQNIVEHSRTNIHNLLLALNESKDARTQRDILGLIKNNKGGLTVRDICRMTHSTANEVKSALEVLCESGELEEIEHKTAVGRPTKVYILTPL